jgi:hypothetical protein
MHNELATLLSTVYHCKAIERTCQLFPRHSFGFKFQANEREGKNQLLCSLGKWKKGKKISARVKLQESVIKSGK